MIKVKKGGSIWKLATFWGNDCLPNDFCSLIKAMSIVLLIVSFFTTVVSAALGATIGIYVALITTGVWLGEATFVTAAYAGMALVVLTAWASVNDVQVSIPVPEKLSEGWGDFGNNAKEVYRGFKEKYCPIIKEVD